MADVRAHRAHAVVCWRLDRLGRNLRHLVMLLDDWHARGIAFITMTEGIGSSTPGGRLVAGVLGSIAEFERARIQERVLAGLGRVRAQGRRLGRKPCAVSDDQFAAVASLSTWHAAERLGVSHTLVARWRAVNKTRLEATAEPPDFPAST